MKNWTPCGVMTVIVWLFLIIGVCLAPLWFWLSDIGHDIWLISIAGPITIIAPLILTGLSSIHWDYYD